MLSLNSLFQRMVLKYIPQLILKDLSKYESLTALRHQVKEDIRTLNWTLARDETIESSSYEITDSINKNNTKNVENYNRVHRLYIAGRQYALQQKNYQQLPASWNAFVKFIKAAINYRNVQIQTLPFLWANCLIYFITNFWSQITVVFTILAAIGWTCGFNFPPEIKTTLLDTAFVSMNYNYPIIAVDPNLNDTLKYSLLDSGFLDIDSLTGLLYGTPPDTGLDTTIVKVTDSHGLSDSVLYSIIIRP